MKSNVINIKEENNTIIVDIVIKPVKSLEYVNLDLGFLESLNYLRSKKIKLILSKM